MLEEKLKAQKESFEDKIFKVKERVQDVIVQYKQEIETQSKKYMELEAKYNDAQSLLGMLCK